MKNALIAFLMLLAGCSAPSEPNPMRGLDLAQGSVARDKNDSNGVPPVLIQGVPVAASELVPRLEEAAGSVVLEEMTLDRVLDKEIANAGLTISQGDIDAERDLLAQTLTDEAKLTPAQAQGMIDNLRKSRGLGPVRFTDMLARNAKLRALVRPRVQVSPEEIDQALAAEFGPKARVRIITLPEERRAVELREQIMRGIAPLPTPADADVGPASPPESVDPLVGISSFGRDDLARISLRFAQAAQESSTDPTAPRGGLIAAISPVDQGLPLSVRKVLGRMSPGDLSGVISTDSGYVLVLMEEKNSEQGTPTAQDRARTEARLQNRKERMAMDRLGRQLLGAATVSPMDQSLKWSWDARPRQ